MFASEKKNLKSFITFNLFFLVFFLSFSPLAITIHSIFYLIDLIFVTKIQQKKKEKKFKTITRSSRMNTKIQKKR